MSIPRLVPGTLLSVGIALLAAGLAALEQRWLGRVWIEPMVLAILLGMLIANTVRLPAVMDRGVTFLREPFSTLPLRCLGRHSAGRPCRSSERGASR